MKKVTRWVSISELKILVKFHLTLCQVSIAGEMGGVERARARVRELTPLLFNFDLPIMPSFQVGNPWCISQKPQGLTIFKLQAAPDTNSPYMRAIMDQYNVQIIPRPKQKNFHAMTIVVKGCEWECARVKEATLLLMDHLCKVIKLSAIIQCFK